MMGPGHKARDDVRAHAIALPQAGRGEISNASQTRRDLLQRLEASGGGIGGLGGSPVLDPLFTRHLLAEIAPARGHRTLSARNARRSRDSGIQSLALPLRCPTAARVGRRIRWAGRALAQVDKFA